MALLKTGSQAGALASSISSQSLTPGTLASEERNSTHSTSPASIVPEAGELTPTEADQNLDRFLTYMLPHFPVVYISSGTTSQQLADDQPFLWLCIMAMSSKSALHQQLLGNEIRQKLAQEIILRCLEPFDLLQGLVVFLGW